jgi:hypothetical protein
MLAYANTSHKTSLGSELQPIQDPNRHLLCAEFQPVGWADRASCRDRNKLKRGTFSVTFFPACIAAMELESIVLEEI